MKENILKKALFKRVLIFLFIILLAAASLVTMSKLNDEKTDIDFKMADLLDDISGEWIQYKTTNPNANESDLYAIAITYLNGQKYNYEYLKSDFVEAALYKRVISEDEVYAATTESLELTSPEIAMVTGECFSELDPVLATPVAIILEDCFAEEQLYEIQEFVKNAKKQVEIEMARGYCKGCFFVPEEIMLTEGKNKLKIKAEVIEENVVSYNTSIEALTFYFSDGTVIGEGIKNITEKRSQDLVQKVGDALGLMEGNDCYWGKELDGGFKILVYSKSTVILSVINELLLFYFILFCSFALIIIYLNVEYDNIIGTRINVEVRRRNIMDSLAHKMKTPLAIIRNYSEIMLENTNDGKQGYFLKRIIDETDELNGSIIGVLDLSKAEAGTYPMELSSVSLEGILNDILKRKEILFNQKNLHVVTEINCESLITADEQQVENIISNYVSNAITHAEKGSQIFIKIVCNAEKAYIEVRNSGKCITEEEKEYIWEPFFGNRASNKKSTGLGLAIVKNACSLHNGDCGFENTVDGVLFWAKIYSMEDEIYALEMETGPVRIHSAVNQLKGLKLACLGLLLCMVSYIIYNMYDLNDLHIGYLTTQANFDQMDGFLQGKLVVIANAFCCIVSLIGNIVLLLSGRSLCLNGKINKKKLALFKTNTAIGSVFIICKSVAYPGGWSTFVYYLIDGLEITELILTGGIGIVLFNCCMVEAKKHGEQFKLKEISIAKWGFIILIVFQLVNAGLLILYNIFWDNALFCDWQYMLALYGYKEISLCFLCSCTGLTLWVWYRTYKKYGSYGTDIETNAVKESKVNVELDTIEQWIGQKLICVGLTVLVVSSAIEMLPFDLYYGINAVFGYAIICVGVYNLYSNKQINIICLWLSIIITVLALAASVHSILMEFSIFLPIGGYEIENVIRTISFALIVLLLWRDVKLHLEKKCDFVFLIKLKRVLFTSLVAYITGELIYICMENSVSYIPYVWVGQPVIILSYVGLIYFFFSMNAALTRK